MYNQRLKAVIDTAAQVTVLSKKLLNELIVNNCKPVETVKLKCAGPGQYLIAELYPKVQLQLGPLTVFQDMYVTDIQDDMLLGLDFLLANKVSINLNECIINVLDCLIPIQCVRNAANEVFTVSKVTLCQKEVVPPHTVKRVRVNINSERDIPMVVEANLCDKFLVPNCVVNSKEPVIPLVNDTNACVSLQSGSVIGSATELDLVLDDRDCSFATSNLKRDSLVSDFRADTAPDFISKTESVVSGPVADTSPDSKIIQQVAKSDENREITDKSTNRKLPDHLKILFEKSSNKLLPEERDVLQSLLIDFQDVFAKHDLDIGCFEEVEHEIDTRDAKPIKEPMRRIPLKFESEEESCIQKMLDAGVIQESNSEWAAAPVVIRKKDGGIRYAIDYRPLNLCTVKSSFSLPDIKHCISALNGSIYFSTLDMASGYYQVKVSEKDRHKTAFLTRFGLFEHVRMGFGLCNAPSTFQRIIQLVLRGLTWKTVLAYLDDVVILGNSFLEHIQNLKETLLRFRQYNLKLKPKKCVLFQKEVKFLGKIVNAEGVKTNPESIQKILDWPVPKSKKQVQQFLGLANYHRDHIKNFSEIARPLYKLTEAKIKAKNFEWLEVHTKAFETLKTRLTEAPLLVYPNNTDLFILDTDASDVAIGAELLQLQNDTEKVVCYGSYVLTPSQRKYCATKKELLAIVRFTRQYRHFLLGRRFVVRTDHNSLAWLMRFKIIQGQLGRWLEELSQYDMQIVHRRGVKHTCGCIVAYP